MVITTNYHLLTAICKESVSEHLIQNLLQFEPAHYTITELKGGKGKNNPEPVIKIELLCTRALYPKVMDYVIKYYVKQYGVTCYMAEASVPM